MINTPAIPLQQIQMFYQQAARLKQQGKLSAAEKMFRQLLQQAPDFVPALNDLAQLQQVAGKWREAEQTLRRALKVEPAHPLLLSNLGEVLLKQDKSEAAITLLEQAVQLAPNFALPLNNLANAYRSRSQYDRAIPLYKKAILLAPKELAIHNNLGACLSENGQYPAAIQILSAVVQANPKFLDAYLNLGNAYLNNDQYEEAAGAFLLVSKKQPSSFAGWMGLGDALTKLQQPEQAEDAYRKALTIDNKSMDALRALAFSCASNGKTSEAIQRFDQLLRHNPKDVHTLFGRTMTVPIVYRSEQEIEQVRNSWFTNMQALVKQVLMLDDSELSTLQRTVSSHTNFYLNYQGRNELRPQQLYGKILGRITQAGFPNLIAQQRSDTDKSRIRVGFISSYLRKHSSYKSHSRWITDLNPELFEVYAIHTGKKQDPCTEALAAKVEHFIANSNNKELVQLINVLRLDALIYLDIGVDGSNMILPALRLAPLQATTYGHPITTGLDTMDYFLSSELMEPENGQEHYSEQLVRLANLCAPYGLETPEVIRIPPTAVRTEDEFIYLNPQSLFKLLPRHDVIYPLIAKQLPKARFWFLSGKSDEVSTIFKQRLQKAFSSEGLQMEAFCVFHPRLAHDQFFGLLQSADALLDPPASWSGFNTSMEALSLNKPIVTLPGEFMRGRHTYGILKMLKIKDLIAEDLDHYIEIAVRLGKDKKFHTRMEQKIDKAKHVLYEDQKPIKDLEKFLLQKCQKASGKTKTPKPRKPKAPANALSN